MIRYVTFFPISSVYSSIKVFSFFLGQVLAGKSPHFLKNYLFWDTIDIVVLDVQHSYLIYVLLSDYHDNFNYHLSPHGYIGFLWWELLWFTL